jgi:hypothetical protein
VEAAGEQAGKLESSVMDQTQEVVSTVREHGQDVVRTAKSETREVVDRTRDAVESEARQRTEELAHSVRRISDGLGALADGRPEEAGPVAGYVRDAASRVGDVAQRLESRGYDGMVQDVSHFARRRPGMFLAGAGLLGFAVGRVLRSGGVTAGRTAPSPTAPGVPGHQPPDVALAGATVSMQPAMPGAVPSNAVPSNLAGDGGATSRQELR